MKCQWEIVTENLVSGKYFFLVHRKCIFGGGHIVDTTIIVSTHVPFGALPHICFSRYFCYLSLANTVSRVKLAEGQIIGLLWYILCVCAYIKRCMAHSYNVWYVLVLKRFTVTLLFLVTETRSSQLLDNAHLTRNWVLACFSMHSLQSCKQKWRFVRKKYLD